MRKLSARTLGTIKEELAYCLKDYKEGTDPTFYNDKFIQKNRAKVEEIKLALRELEQLFG